MKKLLIGTVIGMMASTAMYTMSSARCMRRVKRAISNKVEDIFG